MGGQQGEFDFSKTGASGFQDWRAEQQEQREKLAQRLGLPLGKSVVAVLLTGQCLRGRLSMEDATLDPQARRLDPLLRIGETSLRFSELESCVIE